VNRQLLSIAELAVALGVSRRTVERWLSDGRLARAGLLEANRIGQVAPDGESTACRRFDAASVEQVLWRRRVGGLRRVS
jgi:DNA-binding transcriptional ArsR family regulator